MAADEPPYLTIGTDVSAKYKGAFCEAKVKKVNRVVKCKVTFKNNLGTFMVTDDQIKGPLRIGADIDAKHPEKSQFCEAVINKLQDYSQYTVVFDDGDETTLRRTSLCLKSGRHFAESPTLDQFPLTNPEHFGTPVIGTSKFKRKRRSTMNSSVDYESSEDDDSVSRKVKAIRSREQNPDLGKVVCVDYGDRRKKENWYPGLIYPHPPESSIKIAKEEHLVRSFKDGKYYQVPKRDIREFAKETIQKVENNSLRTAIEKATNYLEKDELPPNWDKALFASLEGLSDEDDSQGTDSDQTSDDEPSEEKDRFVAQLYKFMDERGTPINKAPVIGTKDVNLYRLFKIMHKMGGFNKVTNKNKWKTVYLKMGLPQSNLSGPNSLKFAYKRFLHTFEDFNRKLGCTMVNNNRATRGRQRSDRNFMLTRTRDREPKDSNKSKNKDSKEKVPNPEKKEEKRAGSASSVERKESSSSTKQPDGEVNKKEMKLEDKTTKTPDKKQVKLQQQPPRSEEGERRRATPNKTPEDKRPAPRTASLSRDRKPPEKARTREDARKEKVESPEKKGTRSSLKMEQMAAAKKEDNKVTPVKEKVSVKKEDKSSSRERKPPPPRKQEDKVPTPKEKREVPPREKKEDKEKGEAPKEDKPSPKVKKEDPEEKSPKRKLERLSKEKATTPKTEEKDKPKEDPPETKVVKEEQRSSSRGDSVTKKDERAASRGDSVKDATTKKDDRTPSRADSATKKDEKPSSPRTSSATKKDEPKDKLRPKGKKEESGDEGVEEGEGEGEGDSNERKPPGPRLRGEEGEDPPSKAKRRSLKLDEKDDKESLLGMSDSDESCTNDSEKNYKEVKHNEIEIGDRVKVKYGRGRLQKVYEAKVLKIEMDGTDKRFYVHYAGWNTRYDEWVRKNYIVANISSTKQQKTEGGLKPSISNSSPKKMDRGRPPGVLANTKPDRKNSTSSGCSSSRATRSEKKTQLSGGLESKRRTRRKSGTATSATDTQESDTDAMEEEEDMSSSFKEELFSDDEEKDKFEDANITELEKTIGAEEEEEDKKVEVGKEEVGKKEEVVKSVLEVKALVKPVEVVDSVANPPPPVADSRESVSRLASQTPAVFDSKAALSFEGLIKKSVDSAAVSLIKTQSVAKELVAVREKGVGEKAETKKETTTVGSSSHGMSIFGSVLSSFQNSTITPGERKIAPKDIGISFGSVMKPAADVGLPKKLSHVEVKSRTNLHIPPQDVKISSESGTTSLNLNPAPGNKTSDATLAGAPKLCDTKRPKLEDPFNLMRSLDIKSLVRSIDSAFPAKVEDVKNPVKLVEAKSTDRSGDTKNPSRFGDTKSPIRFGDTKCPTRLADAKSFARLGETRSHAKLVDFTTPAGLGDIKTPARFGDTKTPTRLGDTKTPAKLVDNKSPARQIDAKSLTLLSDNKDSVDLSDSKGSVKVEDSKVSVKLEDNKNLSKVSEIKGLVKISDSKTPVRTGGDSTSGPVEDKSVTKMSEVKSTIKSTDVMPPAKLSDMSLAKLKDSHAKQFLNIPPKVIGSNPPPKVNVSSITPKLSEVKPCFMMSGPNLSPKSSDINPPVKSSDTSFKLCDPGKTSVVKKEEPDNKPKDSFDLLLQSSSTNYGHNPPHKISDVKDVFSFSFGSHSKDSDTAFPKYPSDSLCRITPKPSDTVDVSKMIPGILERLKKDVVSDSKVSDSPPPPKEELSFDFLRGSSKSLSRSDSSNSLRICESDTNDSNAESKDVPPKSENPSDSVILPSKVKTDVKDVQKFTSESNRSSSSPSNICANVEKPNATVISQQASVITATTTTVSKEYQPVLEDKNISLPSKVESKTMSVLPEQNVASTEESALKSEDTQKPDTKKSIFSKVPSLDRFSAFGSAVEKDSPASHADSSLPSKGDNCESKESLFDEIKASFDEINLVSKYEQSSVIKFVSEASEATQRPENSPSAETMDKTDSKSVKEEAVESKGTSDDQDLSTQDSSLGVLKDSSTSSPAVPEKELSADANAAHEESPFSQLSKKDVKKKKLGKKSLKKLGFSSEISEKEGKDKESKMKEGKIKSKKRLRPEHGDSDKAKALDLKTKTKKIKKNKKRFSRHEDSFSDHLKKFEFRDEDRGMSEKMKKRDRKRSEKKFLKSSNVKGEDSDLKIKKKSKKNRDKMAESKKDFFLEKKTKKKRKLQQDDNQDTDSEKESSSVVPNKKRKRKKFSKVKDCSSSDEADFFKDNKKDLGASSSSYLRQDSSKSDDPDMSFLLCEEKVPASPGNDLPDDSSGTSSNEDLGMDLLPGVYPSCSRESKQSILDNTPPTTPSSTESLLSSSPSRDLHYPESTQSCEGEPSELFHSGGRTVARASEEYRAATTLAFAVCKSVGEKQNPDPYPASASSSAKRERGDHSPSKRKKKRVQRYSEAAKSPKHKSTFPRMSKVENYCEDSSGTSPATSSSPPYGNLSTLSFSRSLPHRLSGLSEGSSRYFYVPLHEKDPEKRISVLQDKMAALRKKYMALRAEVIAIDHKRRKLRKKVRESGGANTNPSVHSEDGHSCS